MKKEEIEKALEKGIESKREQKNKVQSGYYKDFKTIRKI